YIDYDTDPENGIVYFNGGGSLTFTDIENVVVSDRDFTVSGTAGDDTINLGYTGDPGGDQVDDTDAIIIGHEPNDDLIEAGAGNDVITSGAGDDPSMLVQATILSWRARAITLCLAARATTKCRPGSELTPFTVAMATTPSNSPIATEPIRSLASKGMTLASAISLTPTRRATS
ncbi:hypothetical protein N8315_10570, partial [Octadecabacter sp.]|nr:hypothetical protein [Octadecabacter sp.]